MPVEPTSRVRPSRRLRYEVRDAVFVAALSLAGSIAIVAAAWVVRAWLA